MLSLGMDLEGEVNNSFGFLSDMDSGTIPRKRPVAVQVQSWNDRNPPRRLQNVAAWNADDNTRYRSEKPYRENSKFGSSEVIYQKPVRNNTNPSFGGEKLQRYASQPSIHQEAIYKTPSPRQVPPPSPQRPDQRRKQTIYSANSIRGKDKKNLLVAEQYMSNMDAMLDSRNEAKQKYGEHPDPRTAGGRKEELYDRWQQSQPRAAQKPVRDIRGEYERDHNVYGDHVRQDERQQNHQRAVENPVRDIRGQYERNGTVPEDRRLQDRYQQNQPRGVQNPAHDIRAQYARSSNIHEDFRRHDELQDRYQQNQPRAAQKPVSDIRGQYERNSYVLEDRRRPYEEERISSMREYNRHAPAEGMNRKVQSVRANNHWDPPRQNGGNPRRGSQEWDLPERTIKQNYGSMNGSLPGRSENKDGSYLLLRTNTYLDAVNALNKTNVVIEEPDYMDSRTFEKKVDVRQSIPVDPPKVPADAKYQVYKKKEPANRMSIVNPDSKAPPPPPPPMPPPLPPQELTSTHQAPWLHDVKAGRKNLKRTPSLPRTELEPESEPVDFKEKLKRILEGQLSAQRWTPANVKKRTEPDEEEVAIPEKSSAPYHPIKTLSKTAIKSKLEIILKDQASFHGESDMNAQRQAALSKMRSNDKENLRKIWERQDRIDDGFDDDFEETNGLNQQSSKKYPGRPPENEPIAARQRMLMGGVVSTINLRGAKDRGSSYT